MNSEARSQSLTPIILAIQDIEIRRIAVQSQLWQKARPYLKNNNSKNELRIEPKGSGLGDTACEHPERWERC
jgi:hypothetical protein